jgi:Glyoxalase/Bleomycin resistance protein/Dioxygenase superfamily
MTTMAAPPLAGLHHLKVPVTDLDTHLDWYQRVFDASLVPGLDHIDSEGARYAAILEIPGVPVPLELRWAPAAGEALRGCDILVLAVDSAGELADWVAHLDTLDVTHSPILTGGGGPVLVMVDPDGKFIRLMVVSPEGVSVQTLSGTRSDPEGPWLNPIPMRHPRAMKSVRQPT